VTDFRTVDDFTIRLIESDDAGKQLEYAGGGERLAGFPAWEHADRDLRHFIHSDIPVGTREEPYEDRDEEWQIAIFEHAGWVYIAERDGKTTAAFRVKTERYMAAWRALIDRFNPNVGLEDLFGEPDA
jgi:hypothetical protein